MSDSSWPPSNSLSVESDQNLDLSKEATNAYASKIVFAIAVQR